MDERIKKIRKNEEISHTKAYTSEKLYESTGWLNKPIKSVEETVSIFSGFNNVRVLDLGCGVGRNSIYIAERLREIKCKIDCVDILPIAIEILNDNATKYNVKDTINGIVSSIEEFTICENSYDFIFSVSSLEHVESIDNFNNKLHEIKNGLKIGGIVLLVINTDVLEIDKNTRETVDANFEVNIDTQSLINLLNKEFCDFEVLRLSNSYQKYDIPRENNITELSTTVVTYVARKIK